jgi:endonuclease/exonuclease/phosphatase family metal-dependent hydrolase
MPDLRVAFWNVQNLFEPGLQNRRPRHQQELDAKLDVLAMVLNGLFDGAGPDLLGLAEVHTELVLARLQTRLRGSYFRLFEPCQASDYTGLSVLARTDRFATLARVDAYRPWKFAMPRYVIARCELRESGEPIILVVNHWTSRLGGVRAANERSETARHLGEWLARSQRDTCVIALGDFNAEPFEAPFGAHGLRCVRHFSPDLWRGPAPACLYNTAWRFLSEPDPWEVVEAGGVTYEAPRATTTYDASPPVLLDQLLVSGRALRSGPITLQEASMAYPSVGDIAAATEGGHRRPVPWTYKAGCGSGPRTTSLWW